MKRFIQAFKTTWTVVGITLILLFAMEISSTLLLIIKDAYSPHHQDPRINADAYRNADWVEDYFEELNTVSTARWKPYVYWRRNPFSGLYINIDPKGFRRTTYPEIKIGEKTELVDIFVFGGSTIWGNCVRDKFTIPSILGKKLGQQGCRSKITNFGEDGYVSTQEVMELIIQIQRGNIPDLVIFFDGINDTASGFHNGFAGITQNEWNREQEFHLLSPSKSGSFWKYVFLRGLRGTNTFRVVSGLVRRMRPSQQQDYKQYTSFGRDNSNLEAEIVEVYISNIRIVNALGKTYGFKSTFYWQPVIYTKDQLTEYERELLKGVGEAMEGFFANTYSLVKSEETRIKGNFVNLSDIFAGIEEPFFIDIFHVSEEGNEIIANRIVKDIIKILKRQ